MPKDTRTRTMATVRQREALTSTHHHTAPLNGDHVAAVVGIGALLLILGIAFVVSWRHSGDTLRSILGPFDDQDTPPAEQASEVDARTADLR